jgi:ABC-type glycerol-3-phosphate transport system permease component
LAGGQPAVQGQLQQAGIHGVLMAASLIAALPTLLVFIFLGCYFLRGLMAGALKG